MGRTEAGLLMTDMGGAGPENLSGIFFIFMIFLFHF
jgi:hypothetical protein